MAVLAPSSAVYPGASLFPGSVTTTWARVPSPARPSWNEAIRGNHRVAVRADLLVNGVATMELPLLDGTVTLDANAPVRGRCDLRIAFDPADSLVPEQATDPLAPYGNEVQIRRGVLHHDGTAEFADLGVYGIYDVSVDDSGGELAIAVAGFDRSQRVTDARFEDPFQIAAGTNVGTAILLLVQAVYPDVTFDFATTISTTPAVFAEAQDDRWALAQRLANDIGMRLYFDGTGTLRLAPVAQPSAGNPIWEIAEGDDGVLLQVGRTWSREGAYNRYIVSGEATTDDAAPPRGVATDDNPASPTYYYGSFGRKPGFYVSSFITTTQQAQDTAQAMLAKQLGTTQQVSFGAIVNPRLQPDDIVRIRRARIGLDEDHAIDTLTIPLAADGAMSGSTRATLVLA